MRRYLALLSASKKADLFPLENRRLCETGCGSGQILMDYVNWGLTAENIYALDKDPQRVKAAKNKLPHAEIVEGYADKLPWPDNHFDIVLQATLFTSILDPTVRNKSAGEIMRVLKNDGVILWYDFIFNNPWNKNVIGMKKSEIKNLFPGMKISLKRTTLWPQLGRIIVPISWTIAWWLEKLPFLCTHYIGIIRR